MLDDDDPVVDLDGLAEDSDSAVIGPRDSRVQEIETTRFPWNTVVYLCRDFGIGMCAGFSGALVYSSRPFAGPCTQPKTPSLRCKGEALGALLAAGVLVVPSPDAFRAGEPVGVPHWALEPAMDLAEELLQWL